MVLKEIIDPIERTIRINNQNPKIFKKAYKELEKAVEYAEANFKNTAIYP